MNKIMIINGDDFGVSSNVNQAIIKAYEHGILTSTSLMVSGDAFEEAVLLAKSHLKLAVGLHLVVCCGKSVLSPNKIPHLVDKNGYFPTNPVTAGLNYQFNAKAQEELRLEIRAQLEKFYQTGLNLSHVDGHLHLHVHPVILKILVELAEEFKIKFIRLPSEELSLNLKIERDNILTKILYSGIFHQLRRQGEGLLTSKGINYAERVYGLLQSEKITEEYLLDLIPQIQASLVEIYAHPSFSGSGTLELNALLSPKVQTVIKTSDFQLNNYNEIADK